MVLIKQSSEHESGLIPISVDVVTYPLATAEEESAGMSLMLSLPSGPLKPDKFVKDSHIMLKEVMRSILKHFAKSKPQVAAEWKHWAEDVAPKNDDAGEYCATHPLVIPFSKELFGIDIYPSMQQANGDVEPREVHRRFTNA